jgi:hypothetical protein
MENDLLAHFHWHGIPANAGLLCVLFSCMFYTFHIPDRNNPFIRKGNE